MGLIIYGIYLAVAVPVTAIVSGVVYLVRVPAAYLAALARVLILRPSWLPDPQRWPETPSGSDPAVLHYFYGPAAADAAQAAETAFDESRRRWALGVNAALRSSRQRGSTLNRPLGIAAATGMTIGTLAGVIVAACCALGHIAIVGISSGLVRACAVMLRAVGSIMLRVRSSSVTCPACAASIPFPVYTCPGNGCKRRHGDLRPGRFGILRHRCHCGTSMRTVLFPGSPDTTGFCPGCGQFLEPPASSDTEFAVPVFEMVSAAESEMLLLVVTQLKVWDREGKLNAVLVDPPSIPERRADGNRTADARPSGSLIPRAYTVRLIAGAQAAVLRVFDAAGALDAGPPAEPVREATQPGRVRTLIVVTGTLPSDSGSVQEQALRAVKALGVPARDARVAMVFTGDDPQAGSGGRVLRWVRRELESGHLIRRMRREFKGCLFSYVSPHMPDEVIRDSIESLVRWVLTGVGISPSPSRVVTDLSKVQERAYRWQRGYVSAAMMASVALLALFLI